MREVVLEWQIRTSKKSASLFLKSERANTGKNCQHDIFQKPGNQSKTLNNPGSIYSRKIIHKNR